MGLNRPYDAEAAYTDDLISEYGVKAVLSGAYQDDPAEGEPVAEREETDDET